VDLGPTTEQLLLKLQLVREDTRPDSIVGLPPLPSRRKRMGMGKHDGPGQVRPRAMAQDPESISTGPGRSKHYRPDAGRPGLKIVGLFRATICK
ncbi:unnamed protein product, partial [Didymodactylos carnosus]